MNESLHELLSVYYDRIFPAHLLYKWLSYGENSDYFARREFAFTKNGGYIRYKSYGGADNFKSDLVSLNPEKIHIGAVYNLPPKEHSQVASSQFLPVEKELIFDVDANDFDDVRICPCRGSPQVCNTCWDLMRNTIKILESGLREDFGFKYIIWIFSGRRGIHCWVCDAMARQLSQEERSAIASYLGTLGHDITTGNIRLHVPLHPSLNRAHVQVVKPHFEDLVNRQNLLDDAEMQSKLISYLTDDQAQKEIKLQWGKRAYTSHEKWEQLRAKFFDLSKKNTNHHSNQEINVQFYFGYPRLDIQVSKQQIHLLKAPFSVHPETGCICVPIVDSATFDPTEAPTLKGIIREFEMAEKSAASASEAVKMTSLAPYLEFFCKFIFKVDREGMEIQRRAGSNIQELF